MPVCKKCKKYSNCLTVDFCEHCGAKDWDTRLVRKTATAVTDDFKGCITGLFTVVGGALLLLFYLVLVLGGLWLLVAVVKWMWEHS
jgi:hypothetical protein